MYMEKYVEYFDKYFQGLLSLKLSDSERKIIVGEIVAGIEVLMNYPDISFDDWWEELHELWERKYWK